MGNIRTERRQQYMEEISYDFLQHLIDISVQAAKNIGKDILGYGVISGGAVAQTDPVSMSVNVAAMLGYSALGDHLRTIASVEVDCSEDYAGASTIPLAGNLWISIFAFPDWTDGDERPDGIGNMAYHTRTEAVEFQVRKGTATAVPANPGSGAIRICSIRLSSSTTSITTSMVNTGTGYRDTLTILGDRVKKAGDNLTGSVLYNGKPLIFSNSGTTSLRLPPGSDPWAEIRISGLSNSDFDNHYALSSQIIDTGISSKNLHVLCTPKTNLFHLGSVAQLFINPVRLRWHTDFVAAAANSTFTEGLLIYQEVDANDTFTGRIQIIVIGSQLFVSRFINVPIRWLAVAPMPSANLI